MLLPADQPEQLSQPKSRTDRSWVARYSQRHRLQRLTEFPTGLRAPRRVRIYQRTDHYVLQWWDRAAKRTLSERINGDLLTALYRSRHIDERLDQFRSAGTGKAALTPEELVTEFVVDLDRRVNAREIDLATAERYRSALAYFSAFVTQPDVSRRYRHATAIDRGFRLEFAAYLDQVRIQGKGSQSHRDQRLKSKAYVLDVVRTALAWGADPLRGNLMTAEFHNPFTGHTRRAIARDPIRPLDITLPMAVELLQATDAFQLPIFATLLLYGLRPGELGWLFTEYLRGDWLRVPNIPELDYTTKGRRDKRFPVPEVLQAFLKRDRDAAGGLLFVNRPAGNGKQRTEWSNASLAALATEYRRRCVGLCSVIERRHLRDTLLKEAGQLTYDAVENEFGGLARRLGWPADATLKDFRHLFCTCLENAGVPEYYRRYLMGHAPGNAPIATYTHLTEDKIDEHFRRALSTEMGPLVEAICQRAAELNGSAQITAR